jgi:hypothetical protein
MPGCSCTAGLHLATTGQATTRRAGSQWKLTTARASSFEQDRPGGSLCFRRARRDAWREARAGNPHAARARRAVAGGGLREPGSALRALTAWACGRWAAFA